MKKLIYSFLALGALVISSCSSDPCKDKSALTLCSGNGTLEASGSNCNCKCNAGYSGTNCSTLVMTSIIGSWNQVSTALIGSSPNARTGTTTIVADVPAVSRVKITNLNQYFGCSNGGVVTDVICYGNITNGEIVLEETPQCGVTFKGKGVKQTDGSWKFTYSASNTAGLHNCETTLKK